MRKRLSFWGSTSWVEKTNLSVYLPIYYFCLRAAWLTFSAHNLQCTLLGAGKHPKMNTNFLLESPRVAERARALTETDQGVNQRTGALELCYLGQGWALVSWIWNKESIQASVLTIFLPGKFLPQNEQTHSLPSFMTLLALPSEAFPALPNLCYGEHVLHTHTPHSYPYFHPLLCFSFCQNPDHHLAHMYVSYSSSLASFSH